MESLCRYFAVALAKRRITVNAISPLDRGQRSEHSAQRGAAEIREWHEGGWIPMGHLGTSADIGNAVVLLCSEEASWITGQTLAVDGGASLMETHHAPRNAGSATQSRGSSVTKFQPVNEFRRGAERLDCACSYTLQQRPGDRYREFCRGAQFLFPAQVTLRGMNRGVTYQRIHTDNRYGVSPWLLPRSGARRLRNPKVSPTTFRLRSSSTLAPKGLRPVRPG